VFESNLLLLISSLKEGNLSESATAFISGMQDTEEMLQLLQGLEEIRVDAYYSQAKVRHGYNGAILLIAKSRAELLLLSIKSNIT
jgi:hypothetical protein